MTAFVLDEHGRLLMIRRTDNDLYSIPGGMQDVGETIGHTVVREVKEETGIDAEPTDVIGIYSDPAHVIAYTDGEVRQQFSICFPRSTDRRRTADQQRVKRSPLGDPR